MRQFILFIFFSVLTLGVTAQKQSNISTQNLNALLGTSRLFAMKNMCSDSFFVYFLNQNPNCMIQKKINEDKKKTIFICKEKGVKIITRKTGIDYKTIDDFVETIEIIKPKEKQKLPYNCNASMSLVEWKKQLKLLNFKPLKISQKKVKGFQQYWFTNATVRVELWFKGRKLHKIAMVADLDKMYGGLLIE